MREDRTIPFVNPALRDELSELVREGARQIIRQAVEAELGVYLEEHEGEHDGQGRRAVVRNGYLPSREVLTGVGPVRVQVPRTRERAWRGAEFVYLWADGIYVNVRGAALSSGGRGLRRAWPQALPGPRTRLS